VEATFWLRVAGYLTWIVCSIPGIVALIGGRMSTAQGAAWAASFAAFGLAFTLCSRRFRLFSARPALISLIAAQSTAGLMLVWTSGDGMPAATLVVVAAELQAVFSSRVSLAWVAAQSVLLSAVFWMQTEPLSALVGTGAYAAFQMFAIAASWLAFNERSAREDLARTNAELTATRDLLAENSRVAERLRISRDLHDALGHHLAALSIQLEVASRLTSGQAADHVREAHAIARLLLSDVRDVVSRLRGGNRVDLTHALRSLAAGAGPIRIHLEMPDRLDLDDSAQAHAVLRCVQEIITNAARHGAAQNLWIRIAQRSEGLDLAARDDGRGASEWTWGNGLIGMRERFEEYAGRIEVRSALGEGFEVRGFMPRPEALA
jgi:signal transduction histidine kinase